jgi:hypothetical protein
VSRGVPNFSNVESLTITFLGSRGELAGVPVDVRLPPGHDGTTEAVVVSRVGGEFQPDDLIDRALVRIDTYGPDRTAALDLAGTVRGLVWLMPELAHPGGVKVFEVAEDRGPSVLRDPALANANRYTTRYRLHLSVISRSE